MNGTGQANADHLVYHPANRRADLDKVESGVLEALRRHGYPEPSIFAVRLVLEEALVNAFQHGHRGLPPDTTVEVDATIEANEARILVTDQGPGFDPSKIADPTLDENLELPSGRGLLLIRAYMTEVSHDLGGRRLVMRYKRPAV